MERINSSVVSWVLFLVLLHSEGLVKEGNWQGVWKADEWESCIKPAVLHYALDAFDILFHQRSPRDLCTKSSEVRREQKATQVQRAHTEGLQSLELNEAENEWTDKISGKYTEIIIKNQEIVIKSVRVDKSRQGEDTFFEDQLMKVFNITRWVQLKVANNELDISCGPI